MYCEAIINKTEYRQIKIMLILVLSVIIIASTMLTQYQEAHALLPVLALTPAAINAIAGVLYAAGVSFAAYQCIDDAVKFWYSDVGTSMRNEMMNAANTAVNGVMQVSDSLWNSAKTWIQSKFHSGTSSFSANYLYEGTGNPVTMPSSPKINLGEAIQIGNDVYEMVLMSTTATVKQYYIYKNGYQAKDQYNVPLYLNHYYTEVGAVDKPYFWLSFNNNNIFLYYTYRANGYEAMTQVATVATNVPLPSSKNITYVGDNVLSNTAYDFKTAEGKREVAVAPSLEWYVGKTYTDVQNKPYSETGTNTGGTTADMTETNTWLENIANTITGGVAETLGNIWEWLQGLLTALGGIITGALSPVISWLSDIYNNVTAKAMDIVNAITGVNTAVLEADLTATTRNYRLPDLFILILKVILACIRLMLRALLYIATIIAIGADGSLLNENVRSGIDFFKNQTIPNLDITVWTMASSMLTILFSMAVVKRIRRMYSV